MPVPTSFTDLSTTPASNSPAGSENVFPNLDDYIRFTNAALASIRANTATNGWVSPYLPLSGGTLTGPVTFASVAGDGSGLTALNASAMSTGTIPDARFPAVLPAVSGVNLTALNAAQLLSGTIPDARFPATLPAGVTVPAAQLSGNVIAARISAAFTSSLTTNGYVTLPNGIIIQWGSYSHGTADGTTTAVTFPITFPNAVYAITSNDQGLAIIISVNTITNSGYNGTANQRNSSSVGVGPTMWIAIGR